MNKIHLIFTLVLICFSCKKDNTLNGFVVNGTIQNAPDSSKVVMYFYPNTAVIVDSTIVINEKFQFIGEVERPQLAMLRIESTRDSKMFWIENQKINISGEKGDFVNSNVSGSITQKEAEMLLERKDSIFNEMNELEAMVTEKNRDSLFVIYEQMENEEIRINQQFASDYPDSYESLFRLNISKERLGASETAKVFNRLNPELQITDEGNAIKLFISKNKNLKVGDKYVDFEQSNVNGQTIKFSHVKGKYTLLEFWASWCGPCRSFNPELMEQYELYKEKGFEILSVSLDTDKEKWGKAIQKDGLTWPNVSDLRGENNEVAMIYGVRDIPDNFLIDENGIIIARFIRGESLKNKLKELFD
ncbi:MAG: redoxin domain-containing protein [Flavobacteriales bacterium]